MLNQSSAMSRVINVVFALLACIAAASAVPAYFPHGKTVIYKYYGDVEAGTIEPEPYGSRFAVEGTLYVKHYTSDPTLTNAYYVVLTNVKTGMYNGRTSDYQRTRVLTRISEAANVIQDPFLIVYDENGKLQGVKIPTDEVGWSKNMKMAMVSMLQLDLPGMEVDRPTKSRNFVTKENTIHGDCLVTYDVHAKNQINPNDNELVVTKFSSPNNCTGFIVHLFDDVDNEGCQAKIEDSVNVASRRFIEIEKQGENILIKKLVAHGSTNYMPWNARSEAHYVMTNTTLTMERVVPVTEINLPSMNFQDLPIIRDLTYGKPDRKYATDADTDVTQRRHVVNMGITVTKLKKMLDEAAEYLEENHLEMKEPDWKHGQTVNRILHTMTYMDVTSLDNVFNAYRESVTPKDVTIKNIFLGIVPQVGTTATFLFTIKLIRENKVRDNTAIEMLSKLPLNVKVPTEYMLTQMEDLVTAEVFISIEVRKAWILAFASLTDRVIKAGQYPDGPFTEARTASILQQLFDLFNTETHYDLKVVYLMALRNIRVGKIHELLAPIIRGETMTSVHPVNTRLLAIWAIEKSVEQDYQYACDLLWPVMADKSLSVKLRIAAYEILMNQARTMSDTLRIHWFMVNESDKHLYNYHYTTIKGIANSVDPCKLNLREHVRKIMRFTVVPDTTCGALSTADIIDYKEERYNHAEKLHYGIIMNEVTGVPEVLHLEHIVTDARKPVSNFAIRVHIEGLDDVLNKISRIKIGTVSNANVLEVLRNAAKSMPSSKKFFVDIVLMRKGRVVVAKHYDAQNWHMMWEEMAHQTLGELYTRMSEAMLRGHLIVNTQDIMYDHLYEEQVTSDMGLPMLLETRIPLLSSLKINYDTALNTVNLGLDAKIWRHGDYSMSIYNPIADVWHAIRRSTATDVSIPIRVTISHNPELNKLKINFPRLPATKFSIGGVRTHAKDCVTVNDDDVEALKKSCATCHHHEDVSLGTLKKKYYQNSIDSKDTGLQYSMAIFDCESGVTPTTLANEFYRVYTSKRKNDGDNDVILSVMAMRQQLKNMLISPQIGSCGTLLKIEPSIVHPTSRIDVSVRASYVGTDHIVPFFNMFSSQKYNVRGTVDVIAASTNTSARSWDLNSNIDINRGHLMNVAKIQLTRKTPGETNYKICIDAQKSYSPLPTDLLKLGITKEETNSKLTIAAGYTDEEKCVRDDTLVTVTVKGELSDEQKKQFTKEMMNSPCSHDIKNPLYANPKNIVPKTLSCLNEVIRHTTLRKYTINVAHKKVPQDLMFNIRDYAEVFRSLPLEYTVAPVESGNVKITVEYPIRKNVVDLSVATLPLSYGPIGLNVQESSFNGIGPVMEPIWEMPLDNTRFGMLALNLYNYCELKMCSVYQNIVLNVDGKNIPFNVPEQWTLISGDHTTQLFAVFAKMIGNNMAVAVFVENRVVEIIPNADNSVQVMIDYQVVDQLDEVVLLNNDMGWILKATKYNDHIIVQLKAVPMVVVHGINHVALVVDTPVVGRVSGLCGHLNGTDVTEIPNFHMIM